MQTLTLPSVAFRVTRTEVAGLKAGASAPYLTSSINPGIPLQSRLAGLLTDALAGNSGGAVIVGPEMDCAGMLVVGLPTGRITRLSRHELSQYIGRPVRLVTPATALAAKLRSGQLTHMVHGGGRLFDPNQPFALVQIIEGGTENDATFTAHRVDEGGAQVIDPRLPSRDIFQLELADRTLLLRSYTRSVTHVAQVRQTVVHLSGYDGAIGAALGNAFTSCDWQGSSVTLLPDPHGDDILTGALMCPVS